MVSDWAAQFQLSQGEHRAVSCVCKIDILTRRREAAAVTAGQRKIRRSRGGPNALSTVGIGFHPTLTRCDRYQVNAARSQMVLRPGLLRYRCLFASACRILIVLQGSIEPLGLAPSPSPAPIRSLNPSTSSAFLHGTAMSDYAPLHGEQLVQGDGGQHARAPGALVVILL